MTTRDLLVPFRGERYRDAKRLSAVVAPPYDVITPEQRATLAARAPHNMVHLVLPERGAGDPYEHAASLLTDWRSAGVWVRDAEPTITVLAQDFAVPGGGRRSRLGMFAALVAEPYDTRRVRPHEHTHSGPKADRLALLRATRTSLESILVLAPDADGAMAATLAEIAGRPPHATAELDGVGIRVWIIGGSQATQLTTHHSPLPVYIADGHHRYETAVAYAKEQPSADRLLALVVSARDPGLTVLPTHRVIFGAGRRPETVLDGWRRWFDVTELPHEADALAHLGRAGEGGTACVVAWGEGPLHLLRLKADAPLAELPELGGHAAVRALDVARVEALVVRAILQATTSTPTLRYSADAAEALRLVRTGAAAAVLLNPTRVEQVIAVADAGGVMPPKSTYFAPKVPCGIVVYPSRP